MLGIDMDNACRERAFEQMETAREILPVQIEGIRMPLYMLTEDLPLMEAVIAGSIDRKARLEFLAPLDPMLWDRKLVEALWSFRYSWEIYTPAGKRRYGYYVLPMLWGESFAGRIEAAADRKTGVLTVKNIWYEKGVRQTKKLSRAIDGAVGRLARFNGCGKTEYGEGAGQHSVDPSMA